MINAILAVVFALVFGIGFACGMLFNRVEAACCRLFNWATRPFRRTAR